MPGSSAEAGSRPAASVFLLLRQKKGTKEKATLLSASPSLRCGATWGARARGVPQNSLRAARSVQTTAASQSTKACVLRHTPTPPPARPRRIQKGWRAKQPHGPSRCSAPSRGRKRHALRGRGRATRWPVWLFGCSAVHPLLAAPAAGRLRGGMRVGARMLRELTRRSCLNGAPQARSEFCGAPRNRHDAGRPVAQRRGRRLGVAFLLGTFLWRSKEEVPRPPGRTPGLRP